MVPEQWASHIPQDPVGAAFPSVFEDYLEVAPGVYVHWSWLPVAPDFAPDVYEWATVGYVPVVEIPEVVETVNVKSVVSPVPEASTWGMMLAGVFLLVLVMKRH